MDAVTADVTAQPGTLAGNQCALAIVISMDGSLCTTLELWIWGSDQRETASLFSGGGVPSRREIMCRS